MTAVNTQAPAGAPSDDSEFEEVKIKSVSGASFTREDGWSFCLPDGADVVVLPGMVARFYGRGVGYMVRGLFIDGVRVFYRTAEEQQQHALIKRFGATPADWLAKWDCGQSCWTVKMGGLGPGYEQAIQVTMAQVLRHMVERAYDASAWSDDATWRRDMEAIRLTDSPIPRSIRWGLSGAQWGAAMSLASAIYMRGPIAALGSEPLKDRLIQVSKHFPGGA
jgi:hypothetical protein